MKKTLTILFALIFVGNIFASESISDYTTYNDTTNKEEVYRYNTDKNSRITNWSVTVEGGTSRFDGDINQSTYVWPRATSEFTFGLGVEYTMTPRWSMGLDYYYLPLGAKNIINNFNGTGKDFVIADFSSQMHNLSLFTSMNLVRTFAPKAKTNWGVWAGIGMGYVWYNSLFYTDRAGQGVKDGQDVHYIDRNDTIDKTCLVVPLSLLVDYNFTKTISAGVKLQYRAFNTDYIEKTRSQGVTNDAVAVATVQLRWKFNSSKTSDDNNHTRNYIIEDNDNLRNELDRIQKRVNNIVIPIVPNYDDRINDLEGRVKKMEDILCPDGPDTDGDGVPDCRDQEPDTPLGNQVDFWGRTIANNTIDESAYIYFDFDKTGLDAEAHKAIAIAAKKLTADPKLMLEVRGFTDNMGNKTYNAGLSQRRADVVKAELIKVYGISEKRIIANGKGKYNPQDKAKPYRPYRTCILFYSSK